MFELSEIRRTSAVIKLVGVGGGGGAALKALARSRLAGVELIAMDTDSRWLRDSAAPITIKLGPPDLPGAGGIPNVGRAAALAARDRIEEALSGADMVLIIAGMGGGTGTGAAPIIAEVARELGALTVGVVTSPPGGKVPEGIWPNAQEGTEELLRAARSVIWIPELARETTAPHRWWLEEKARQVFAPTDEVVLHAVRSLSEITNGPGLIEVDFYDLQVFMSSSGLARVGTGSACGPNRAEEAVHAAVASSPLLELDLKRATGILFHVLSGPDGTLHEVNVAANAVADRAHEAANIIFGHNFDETLGDTFRVTLIATSSEPPALPDIDRRDPLLPHEAFASLARLLPNLRASSLAPPSPLPVPHLTKILRRSVKLGTLPASETEVVAARARRFACAEMVRAAEHSVDTALADNWAKLCAKAGLVATRA